MRNGTIATADPFSHTMRGAVWTAHEWLSEVILAAAHQIGGWTVVVAVTAAVACAATIALLMRALLRWFEPIYALLFAGTSSIVQIIINGICVRAVQRDEMMERSGA